MRELSRIKQQAEYTGDDKPRINQAGIIEKRRLDLHLTATDQVRSGNWLACENQFPGSAVRTLYLWIMLSA